MNKRRLVTVVAIVGVAAMLTTSLPTTQVKANHCHPEHTKKAAPPPDVGDTGEEDGQAESVEPCAAAHRQDQSSKHSWHASQDRRFKPSQWNGRITDFKLRGDLLQRVSDGDSITR